MTESAREVLRLALELPPEERARLVQELVATLPATLRAGVVPADLYEVAPPSSDTGPTLRELLRGERDAGQ